jgi:hypothetical protein
MGQSPKDCPVCPPTGEERMKAMKTKVVKHKTPGNVWMVVNMSRGWFDGIYLHRKDAEMILEYFAEEVFPGEALYLVQIHASVNEIGIPDHLWTGNREP